MGRKKDDFKKAHKKETKKFDLERVQVESDFEIIRDLIRKTNIIEAEKKKNKKLKKHETDKEIATRLGFDDLIPAIEEHERKQKKFSNRMKFIAGPGQGKVSH